MHNFVRNLITEWRRLDLPIEGGVVVVGVSGGADSVSLLLALHKLRETEKLNLRIVAGHFNHRLRHQESDADEEFVRRLTSEHRIEFAVGQAETLGKGNLEQNARDLRYSFLTQTANNLNAFAVLTGHTINDQAETFLINLIRGSGPEGLAGMRPVRSFEFQVSSSESPEANSELESRNSELGTRNPPLLVRPLLAWAKRRDTEEYCDARGVDYRYDTMNEDTAFQRVRIRKILLPLLEDFNPKIIETLSNTAGLMQKLAGSASFRNQLDAPDEMSLGDLIGLTEAELYEAIRSWLRTKRGTTRRLQLKHIEAIERLIRSKRSGRVAELPGGRVVKTAGKLVYEDNKVENSDADI